MLHRLANVGAIAVDGRAVLIEGEPGSGKSSLALAMIDRGAILIGDDGVTLTESGGQLIASPPENIAGKLEIRNLGLIDLPTTSAPVSLVIRLDQAAPRHIEKAAQVDVAGQTLPLIRLYPDTPYLALRAEWALRIFGLPKPRSE